MTEKQLHKAITMYIKCQYPKVIFNTDLSGVYLPKKTAKEVKELRSSNSFPDIVIYEQGIFNDISCNALFLEVKKETPYKKNGYIKKSQNNHLANQEFMIKKLNSRGFYACFVWSFDQAKKIIDNYLNS